MSSVNRKIVSPLLAAALALLATAGPWAATTSVVRDDTFASFQQGELEGVALSSDGYLYPSYERNEIGDTGTEIVWSAVQIDAKTVLCATGHDGKLVRIKENNDEPEIVADLEEPELTAMVRLDDGSVLIAAAPTGRIYRLDDDDNLTTFTQIAAKFIWDLEVDGKGNIWAATGTEGKLYKITQKRSEVQVEVACDLDSKNLIDLWIDTEGKMGDKGLIYLAGQDPGWLYRYKDGDEEASVIFNAESDEIRAIHPAEEGLALAVNTERAPSPQVLNLTLRLSGAPVSGASASGGGGSSSGSSQAKPDKAMGDVFATAAKKPRGGSSSRIILLTAEGFARTAWTSPERPIHSISATPDGNLLIAAGGKGRLFELLPDDAFAVVADLKEDYVVNLIPIEKGWLLTAARNGTVSRMGHGRTDEAIYRSRVIDAETPVRWGRFHWRGEIGDGQKVSVAFRKGNTADPNKGGWGDWTKDTRIRGDGGVAIPTDPSRYIQYRLTLENGRNREMLKTDYVEAFYQQPNRRPRVTEVAVSDGPATRSSSTRPPSSSSSSSSTRPSSSSSGSRSSSARTATATKTQGGGREPHSNTHNLNVTWKAADPNGDSLVYSLYFRASDEEEWKLIDDELRSTRLPLGINGVGDGRYRFRVKATDGFSNPPGQGLVAEGISDEIVIDNTPPEIEKFQVRADGDRGRLILKVVDDLSMISSIQVDLDGGDAYPLFPNDGFFDQREEEIEWTTLRLEPGEHVLTIAVTDRRGNTVVVKEVFRTGR